MKDRRMSDPYYTFASPRTLEKLKKPTRGFYLQRLKNGGKLPSELAARVLVNAQSEPRALQRKPVAATGRPRASFIDLMGAGRKGVA